MSDDTKQFEPRGLGAFKSPTDYRTVTVSAVAPMVTASPASFFVDVMGLPIWNQQAIGACVGHGAGKDTQAAEKKETGKVVRHSPRFLYAICKAQDGLQAEGTYPMLAMKALKDYGCATEDTVPNDTALAHEDYVYHRNIANIPATAFAEAEQYKIDSYASVEFWDEEKFKQAIIKCNGVILSVECGASWWTRPDGTGSWAAGDLLPLRRPTPPTGLHLIYVYGYETINGVTRYHIINSWSEAWADMGKAYFDYPTYRPSMVEAWGSIDLPNDWKEHLKNLPKKEEFKHVFTKQLKFGDRGPEVIALQTFYKIIGLWPQDVKILSTNIYGKTTQGVTAAFMRKYAVATESEIQYINGRWIGPKTRATINNLIANLK